MHQIKKYMADRDAEDLETLGFIGINVACILTVVSCIAHLI